MRRTRLLENEIRVLRDDNNRLTHEKAGLAERVKDNHEKIKLNKQLPYLVANVVELLDLSKEELEEMAAESALSDAAPGGGDGDASRPPPKSVVIKTTQRQTVYLPVAGLVDTRELKPGDLIGTNKDSFLILEKLPTEYDPRVKAMELDEKPTEDYSDVGGCDKQIQELIEAIVLPMTHGERFKKLGVHPPKGVLLHGRAWRARALTRARAPARAPLTRLAAAPPPCAQPPAPARRCWRARAPSPPTPCS